LKPDWAEGWWYLGTLQYDADEFAGALPAFQSLATLMPQNAAAWNFLGLSEFETGAFDAAKIDLERGLALPASKDDETRKPAAYHLALLQNKAGEFLESLALLKKEFAGAAIPEEAKYAFGLAALHIGLLPKEIAPSNDASIAKVGEAAVLLAQGKTDAAIRDFQDAESSAAGLPYFHCAYGQALETAGDAAKALAEYQRELAQFAENGDARTAVERLSGRRVATSERAMFRAPDPRISKLYARAAVREPLVATTMSSHADDPAFNKLKKEADAFVAAGKWNEAIAALQRAVEIRPTWDDGLWQLATATFAQGRMTEALRALQTWTGRNPDSGTAWAMVALAEFSLRDFDNSRIHFERAESLGFTGAEASLRAALYRYALLKIRAGRFSKAQQLLADRRLNTTADPELQFAIGLASLHVAQFPEDVPATQSSLISKTGEAMALLYASKYDEGLPQLKALVTSYPKAPMLHYLYGKALSALSSYDEAAEQFLLETKLSPRDAASFTELALTRLQQHRASEGIAPAQQAVKLAPDSAKAHYALGRIYLDVKKYDDAQSELETAARFAPAIPEIHFNLAKAYARTNQPQKAEEERAAFARLTEAAERQRAGNRNQTYGEVRGENAICAPPQSGEKVKPPSPN
jgi:tetratricopeptide (TPR) repeat protein